MRIVLFCHSMASCWNHGNAHFLRGLARSLKGLGHEVVSWEPADGWSRANLVADHGPEALAAFRRAFPDLDARTYDPDKADLAELVEGANLVLAHEWNEPAVVNGLGAMRARGAPFVLLFHDTHHRAATAPQEMAALDLSGYDGVLAFGAAIAAIYRRRGWGRRVWVWHEAADVSVFHPRPAAEPEAELVWVGNWGDRQRSRELKAFLLEPAAELGLSASLFGVRYPRRAVAELRRHGMHYRGWLPNHAVPDAFARHRVTIHIPRRPYVAALPGVPTIRMFEALACGIPLIVSPWSDSEGLFPPGSYLSASDGAAMRRHLSAALSDRDLAQELAETGLRAVRERHTCRHRAEELLAIHASLAPAADLREAV